MKGSGENGALSVLCIALLLGLGQAQMARHGYSDLYPFDMTSTRDLPGKGINYRNDDDPTVQKGPGFVLICKRECHRQFFTTALRAAAPEVYSDMFICSRIKNRVCDQLPASPNSQVVVYMSQRHSAAFYGNPSGLTRFMKQALSSDRDEEPKIMDATVTTKGLTVIPGSVFNQHIAGGKHFIVFKKHWCKFCQQLAPTWQHLGSILQHNNEISIGEVDCDEAVSVCKQLGVQSVPTLLLFNNGRVIGEHNGERDIDTLLTVLERTFKPLPKPWAIQTVSAKPTFSKYGRRKFSRYGRRKRRKLSRYGGRKSSRYGKPKFSISAKPKFIAFTAPWCRYCDELKPTWQQLQSHYSGDPRVTIDMVNCETQQDICAKEDVRQYPTLIFFPPGQREKHYNEERSLQKLTAFLEEWLPPKPVYHPRPHHQVPLQLPQPVQEHIEPAASLQNAIASLKETLNDLFHFVLFCKEASTVCHQVEHTWRNIGRRFGRSTGFRFHEVDCDKDPATCSHYKVGRKIPYVHIIHSKDGVLDEIPRSLSRFGSLHRFLHQYR